MEKKTFFRQENQRPEIQPLIDANGGLIGSENGFPFMAGGVPGTGYHYDGFEECRHFTSENGRIFRDF
jgi:hypothetical protein